MRHVRQTDLIRLVAGELADQDRAEVKSHLAECPECAAQFAAQESVWRVLDEWQPEAAPADLLVRIEQRPGGSPVLPHPLRAWAARLSRVAAAVLLGLGVGYGAARTSRPNEPPSPTVQFLTVEDAAVEALGIGYLAVDSPAGLAGALGEALSDPDQTEGQS